MDYIPLTGREREKGRALFSINHTSISPLLALNDRH